MEIVIVGGGTAGWLAALYFSKVHSGNNITLIESEDIGIIGAGEGSTNLLSEIISGSSFDFGCNEREFIYKTGATMKYGIRHKGWTNNIEGSYVGPIDGSTSYDQNLDINFLYAAANLELDEIHRCSSDGYLIRNKKSSFSKDLKSIISAHAYHFDAHLVGKYFKEICIRNNVTCINDQVINVNLKEDGFIKDLLLKSRRKIEGDFFVDASGFRRVLISEVGSKWISYKKHLPVNTALPFQIQYKDNEEIEPTTLAWAHKAGWMWRIPVKDRYGAGYVFCDDFITADQAQEEIEISLGHKIDPIRLLKFDTGRLDKFWNKNCLAIGLSSAFTEPLEAMSIHSTILMLRWFTLDFFRETVDQTYNNENENLYNQRCDKMFETFKDFLVAHYQGGRNDSEFWKYITSGATQTDFVRNIIGTCKKRIPNKRDFDNFWGSAGWGLWSFVLLGTGNITKETAIKEMKHFGISEYSRQVFEDNERYLKNNFDWLIDNTEFINILRTQPERILREL